MDYKNVIIYTDCRITEAKLFNVIVSPSGNPIAYFRRFSEVVNWLFQNKPARILFDFNGKRVYFPGHYLTNLKKD